jgi:hypothetical protein
VLITTSGAVHSSVVAVFISDELRPAEANAEVLVPILEDPANLYLLVAKLFTSVQEVPS